jgi:hypothetical protein
MSSSRTSGLMIVEHIVATATMMRVCLIKQQFLTVGNGITRKDDKVRIQRSCFLEREREKFEITLENVKFVALMNGFMIENEGVLIKFTKVESKLEFYKRLNIKGVFVSGIRLVPVLNQVANTVFWSRSMTKTMSVEINKLHKIFDHCGETHLRETASAYGIMWIGSSKVPGERPYVDISLIKRRVLEEPRSVPLFWMIAQNLVSVD